MEQQNITGNITAPDFEALRSERKVHVCWERVGNCLWHTNCADDAHGSGIMKQGCTERDKTLLTCLSCGAETWAPHGMHDRVVYALPPAAHAA